MKFVVVASRFVVQWPSRRLQSLRHGLCVAMRFHRGASSNWNLISLPDISLPKHLCLLGLNLCNADVADSLKCTSQKVASIIVIKHALGAQSRCMDLTSYFCVVSDVSVVVN